MENEIDTIKNILKNLKEDPMRVIYTEHYLEQIEKRKIPDICIEDLIENGGLLDIRKYSKSRFELQFRLNESDEIYVIISPFNRKKIILITARHKNDSTDSGLNSFFEFEAIYDLAFDLLDLHSKHCFEYGKTIEIDSRCFIDFDSGGRPVAIEMLEASKKFKMLREQLLSTQLDGQIEITEDLIKIHLKATIKSTHKNTRVFEKEIPNEYGIPENTFDLKFEKIIC